MFDETYVLTLVNVSGDGSVSVAADAQDGGQSINDGLGNSLASSVTSAPVVIGDYAVWADQMGLTAGVNDGPLDDPDADGCANLVEFAHDGDPLSGAKSGKKRMRMADDDGGSFLTLTLPFRVGANFTGAQPTATIDGISYTIQADDDLSGTDLLMTERTMGVDDGGLPALNSGYEYRSFRLTTNPDSAAFCWVKIDKAN